ncbi:MAG TPA: hypothetical protein VHB97_24910 [Polyangia bacterium]|nr:hypothetical protein [Polyangia bacterium]
MTARFAFALVLCVSACSPQQGGIKDLGGGQAGDDLSGPGTGGNGGPDLSGQAGGGGAGGGGAGGGGSTNCKVTCAQLGATCGQQSDGCGGMQDCGSCTAPDTCGGGGMANQCGATTGGGTCVKSTCASLNATCGTQGDGCGGTIDCGTCTSPNICGGGGTPNVCGGGTASNCTGLCLQQQSCPNNGTTSISGTVYAPTNAANGYGNPDPLYGALVYVPNGTVQAFTPNVSCGSCAPEVSGNPLVSYTTGVDGKFTITNAPVGTNIPLVIQLGRWRRQIVIPTVTACVNTALTADQTRLPRNKSEGDIPHIAIVTGDADPIECVLPKIGIDAAEFTLPSAAGRVHIYQNNGSWLGNKTPNQAALVGTQATLDQYDMVIFDCIGEDDGISTANQTNVLNYTNAGGRVFASHYAYDWLYNFSPFSTTATWSVDPSSTNSEDSQTATVLQATQLGKDFATWLQNVAASTTLGSILVNATRKDVTAVAASSVEWMSASKPGNTAYPLEYTFDTPVGSPAATQCGRVNFSDFHVYSQVTTTENVMFPGVCGAAAPMSAQEKVLEFLLFNLSSCITPIVPPPPPTCTPITCAAQGLACGTGGDGCGHTLDCGDCMAPDTCGGGGVSGQCGHVNQCTPITCAAQNIACGPAGDGCGNVLDCGTCVAPQTCGGGGTPGQCGGNIS